MEEKRSEINTYRPELLSRRGEVTAWAFTLLLLGVLLVVRARLPDLSFGAYLFLGFFVFAALSISLGNWMDRQTELQFDAHGITYRNGLRHSSVTWAAVDKVSVTPSRLGDKVHVVGANSHFHFRLMGEIKYQGQTRGRVGFPDGEQILQTILERSGLQEIETAAATRVYARG